MKLDLSPFTHAVISRMAEEQTSMGDVADMVLAEWESQDRYRGDLDIVRDIIADALVGAILATAASK